MSPKARGIVPIAIVVCASVSALVFKGTTEWLVDLFVSVCGGLAYRLKSSPPDVAEPAGRKPRPSRGISRKPSRNLRHRAARSGGVRKPRSHRPARVRLGVDRATVAPLNALMADARQTAPEAKTGSRETSLGHRISSVEPRRFGLSTGLIEAHSSPEPDLADVGLGV